MRQAADRSRRPAPAPARCAPPGPATRQAGP